MQMCSWFSYPTPDLTICFVFVFVCCCYYQVFGIQTLHVLYLSGLQLESLPEELSSLRHLRELHCNDNALTEIPPVVMRLPSLQLLNLSNNRISFVPSEVPLAMPQLRQLFLSGNPTGVSPWMQSCDSLHIVL